MGEGEITDVPRVLVDLVEFGLVFGDRDTCAVKDDKARAGGTLVNGADETILEVVRTTAFVLQERAVAVVGLVGVDVNLRLRLILLLLDSIVEVCHVKGIPHDGGWVG